MTKDKRCVKYEILNKICGKVGLIYSENGKNFMAAYEGGCYEDGSPAFYVPAKPKKKYTFDWIPVEIRSANDPYTAFSKSGYDFGSDSSMMFNLSVMFLLIGLFMGAIVAADHKKKKGTIEEIEHIIWLYLKEKIILLIYYQLPPYPYGFWL